MVINPNPVPNPDNFGAIQCTSARYPLQANLCDYQYRLVTESGHEHLPEQSKREDDAAHNRRRHPPLWQRDTVVRLKLAIISWQANDHVDSRAELSQYHSKERQATDAGIEAMNLLEYL